MSVPEDVGFSGFGVAVLGGSEGETPLGGNPAVPLFFQETEFRKEAIYGIAVNGLALALEDFTDLGSGEAIGGGRWGVNGGGGFRDRPFSPWFSGFGYSLVFFPAGITEGMIGVFNEVGTTGSGAGFHRTVEKQNNEDRIQCDGG